MINAKIAVADCKSMYMHQIVTGFILLEKQKRINCLFCEKKELATEFFHGAIIELLVEGKRVIYDLTDGYNNFPSFDLFDERLNAVDFYFKANVKEEFHVGMKNQAKIFPLAPRYYVTCKNSWLNSVDIKEMLFHTDLFELKKLYHKIPFCKNAIANRFINEFEAEPVVNKEPKVFFYTRVWDPGIASSFSSANKDLDGEDVEKR